MHLNLFQLMHAQTNLHNLIHDYIFGIYKLKVIVHSLQSLHIREGDQI